MDETKTRWYIWIADHAQYFFWGVWGAGLGAFGLVLTKALDMSGVAAPIYLGMLTVAMSAMAGLMSSRGMDRLVDRRATARKTNIALMRIRWLAVEMAQLRDALISLNNSGGAANLKDGTVIAPFAARITRVGLAARTLPDFDSLETDEDVFLGVQVTSTFLTIQSTFPSKLPENDAQVEYLLRTMVHPTALAGISKNIKILGNASERLGRKR